ncbi:odorant receptor 85c-like isoform X4 [Rhodnius prolixus]|uniref:odorant receptor 85c-like isoform X4 n=1 Tax=Rhodnius prolixus TaxID=13249 RepID=UPI003D188B02
MINGGQNDWNEAALNRLPERAAIMYQKIYGKKCNGKITEYHENPSLQHCYNECIKQNIKHHIRIIRLINDMNTFWNYTLMIFFFVSTISMAFSGILIMFGDGKITTLVNALVMGFTEIFDVFYICWCGKSISDASELLYMALYDTKWINANKESAKFILIMMAMTKNPYEIYFNSINKLPANFETFANLINTAYSYFNLLYAFREDKAN